MRSIAATLTTRLVPALLTAAGVVLVVAGLLSYTNPTAAGVAPIESDLIVTLDPGIGLATPSPEPTDEAPTDPASESPSASAPASLEPSPSGSAEPSESPTETDKPDRPDPTIRPGRTVATRVVVPALNIDLPVVKGNDGYPYCNVAMYLHTANSASKDAFGQPGEGKATYLYAHARDGMFGPIYELAIVKDTPRKMLGMLVEVYTSDFKRHLYEIREVRRDVRNLNGPLGAKSEELWLQTSEGPAGTPGKTQLRAFPISVSDADPREAVPKARPVNCG
jgi:hypothetical protein